MKNYATTVLTLYEGIYLDAAIRWPDIRNSMELDLSYLRRAAKERGLAFFTLTLPNYGHWLDLSLDHGSFYDYSEIPRGIPRYRGRPQLFWGLILKVFSTDGMLRSTPDPEAVLFLRTLCQSAKKLEVPVGASALKKTVKEFFDVEKSLPRSYPDTWDCEIPIWKERIGHPLWGAPTGGTEPDLFLDSSRSRDPSPPWDSLRQLCRRVFSEVGSPDWWSLRPKHGPGAVADRDWKVKYEFPTWPRKLDLWFPFDWFGSGQLDPDYYPSDRELPSRLIAVPKTAKGPRLICSEPIAHQWIQQGIWRWLRDRIPLTTLGRSIRFEDQTRSQEWALAASRDGSLATLDLSSASDRLSTRLVEYIFQGSDLLNGMHACRTRSMEQSLLSEFPKLTVLRKFATMGSALTFPVQTIVFTILSVWALRLYEGREYDFKNWKADFDRVRVFGDDIIVPTYAYGITKFVLHECGLSVNTRKSFGGSHFRESCGMDAFQGVDVTPARHRLPYSGSAASTAALVEYTNNLYMKGMWYASDKVLSLIPREERKLLLVVGKDVSGLGLFSFGGSDLHLRRSKWDKTLQRAFVVCLSFSAKVRQQLGPGRCSLTQYFTEQAGSPKDEIERLHSERFYRWKNGLATTSRLRKSRVRVYM